MAFSRYAVNASLLLVSLLFLHLAEAQETVILIHLRILINFYLCCLDNKQEPEEIEIKVCVICRLASMELLRLHRPLQPIP